MTERRPSGDSEETAGSGHSPVDAARVFSSVRWVAVGQTFSQVLALGVSVALARLLAPADFGLLTMASVFSALAALFSTLGAGPAIVQRKDLSEPFLRTVALCGIVMGLVLSGALAALSGPLSGFYGEPRVRWIIAALGCSFAVSSFGLVPEALLQRELRFSTLVRIDVVGLLISSAVALSLAWAGFGVWALVASSLCRAAFRSAALVASCGWRLRLGFSRAAVEGVLGFSSSIMLFNLMQYLGRNADNLLIGRSLGATQLGYYDYAYRFYMYPIDAIVGTLINVMFPTFARMQDDKPQLARTFLRANGAIALVTFPMMMGLAAVADPFVRVVLGDQWIPSIPLIYILAPVSMLQAVAATPGQLFLARGRAALRTWWSLVYTSAAVVSFFVGLPWGIVGVATAYAIVMIPMFAASFWIALRLVDHGMMSIVRELRGTFTATVVMGVLVAALRLLLDRLHLPPALNLGSCVATGAVLYALLVRLARPDALGDLQRLLPSSLGNNGVVRWLLASGPE